MMQLIFFDFNYLKNLYEIDEQQFKEPEMQKGVQAMMLLVMAYVTNPAISWIFNFLIRFVRCVSTVRALR